MVREVCLRGLKDVRRALDCAMALFLRFAGEAMGSGMEMRMLIWKRVLLVGRKRICGELGLRVSRIVMGLRMRVMLVG